MKSRSIPILFLVMTQFAFGQDLSDIFEKVSPAVVVISTSEKEILGRNAKTDVTTSDGIGSGVLISEDGLILTASHVVQVAEKVNVFFKDGQEIPAKVVSSAPSADVALIKLMWAPKNPTVVKLGDSDKAKIGEQIFIIGSPYGIAQSLSVGYISGRHTGNNFSDGLNKIEYFQTDAAINQGNSGGPMFNMKGEVIGVVSYILSLNGGFQGLGFAATSNVANEILIDRNHHWTGMEAKFITGTMSGLFNLPQKGALFVQRVASLSPADIAGLKGGSYQATIEGEEILLGGDFILEVFGLKIENYDNFVAINKKIEELKKGDKVNLKVLRRGKIIDLTYISP